MPPTAISPPATSCKLQDVVNAATPGGKAGTDWWLLERVMEVARRANITAFNEGMPQAGTVAWPDDSSGAYTAMVIDADNLIVTQYRVTHADSGKAVVVTYSQDPNTGYYHNPTPAIEGA
ncbi:MAG: hypothetical protein RhofKO_39820 [Rhodothermales bacterium]